MIYIKVSENGMLHTFDCTVSDSVRYETVKFDFPKSWEGYTKTAVFRNGDITLSVILNSDSDLCTGVDECYIPHEVIKFPELTVSVFGVLGDSRVTTSQAAIRVIQSGYGEGGEPSDPTPSEYEQLVNLANETKQIAQAVRDDADNGAFKGDPFTYSDFTPEQLAALKGEKGDPFTYADFTPEQLESLKGKDGIDGKDGTNGKDGYTPQKGVDYFTEEDKAGLKIPLVDQTYTPDSENAQSGKAVAEALSTEQKRADNTFANALKGSKSGSAILIDDISPVTHEMSVKISSDTVEDLTAVKVSRCGKNLFDINDNSRYISYKSHTDTDIVKDGQLKPIFSISNLIEGESYTISYHTENSWAIDSSQLVWCLGTLNAEYPKGKFRQSTGNGKNSYDVKITFVAPTEKIFFFGSIAPETISNFQIENGTTFTTYEPYIGEDYIPTADGTVNGVTSLYPNTTLMTDTDGVLIDCEYNRDINKAFAALEAAIATNNS